MKRGMNVTYAAVASVGIAALAACGTQTGSARVGGDAPVTGVRWVPKSVTADGNEYTLPPGTDAYVEFDPGKLDEDVVGGKSGGSGGCNGFSADVEIEGDTIKVRDMVNTLMGCHAFEERFMEVLRGDLRAKVSDAGKTLTLTKDNGDSITLNSAPPKPPKPLEGTKWTVTGLVENESTNDLPAGAKGKANFTLGKDGRVSGSLGCNTFSAEATVEDGRIEFGKLASTRQMCPGPVMKTENKLRSILSGTVSYDQDHRELSLTADSGTGLTATAD
ncbi:META domain-containing protein [Streptomyces sp. KR80]|uniref:META domain-containing protein n=1 Tax=Streptomyces sp. KR80 TaxID=3457426 RepID=UPI003FD37BBA